MWPVENERFINTVGYFAPHFGAAKIAESQHRIARLGCYELLDFGQQPQNLYCSAVREVNEQDRMALMGNKANTLFHAGAPCSLEVCHPQRSLSSRSEQMRVGGSGAPNFCHPGGS